MVVINQLYRCRRELPPPRPPKKTVASIQVSASHGISDTRQSLIRLSGFQAGPRHRIQVVVYAHRMCEGKRFARFKPHFRVPSMVLNSSVGFTFPNVALSSTFEPSVRPRIPRIDRSFCGYEENVAIILHLRPCLRLAFRLSSGEPKSEFLYQYLRT